MIVKPFRGLRPSPELASKIPSYPYDVVSEAEARALTRNDPYSFLHVVRPEVDLDPDVDPYDEHVYAKGRENFLGMIERGWLARDERPAYYVYRLARAGHAQTGIIGAVAVADYLGGRIRTHEQTRPGKVRDRARLARAIMAHPGSVFLAYRGKAELDAVVQEVIARPPQVDFRATDGIEHVLWKVDAAPVVEEIERLFAAIDHTYVADGHHRAAAAAEFWREHGERQAGDGAGAPSGFFMAAHFPAEQLRILGYHRLVRDLHGLQPSTFLEGVRRAGFEIESGQQAHSPPCRGSYGMYLEGSWYWLKPRAEILQAEDPVDRLDVSVLTARLLQPVLGIKDPRTDPRIDFVGGMRGFEQLERRVDSGEQAVAFTLFPTTMEDVMQAADSGRDMPPKSTWFEPKLRSGMVVQLLEGDAL